MASQLFGDGELVYHSVAVMIHRDRGCREFPFCILQTPRHLVSRRSNERGKVYPVEERVKAWLVDLEIGEIIIIDGNNVGRWLGMARLVTNLNINSADLSLPVGWITGRSCAVSLIGSRMDKQV